MSGYYPVYLDLSGRRCVVLGGGALALEKVEGLLRAEAAIAVFAANPCPALEDLERLGRIGLVRRDYRRGDLTGARLAIDASGDDGVNAAAHAEAQAAGVSLNVVDRAQYCDWIAPAVVRRGPVQLAISTAGESPFLAAALRAMLERWLGEEWGAFARLTGRLRRRLRAAGVPSPEQAAIYQALLRSPAREQLRRGRSADAEFTATALAAGARRGRVTLVGAGPGDPELITVAGRRAMFEADLIFHDALVEQSLLELRGPHTRLVDVGKRAGQEGAGQTEINRMLVEAAGAGNDVVRLKGGDPFVFGRGGEELEHLTMAGIPVQVIPGVTSAVAAPALAGIPLTMRGLSASVAFVTARTADGLLDMERAARAADTLVVLMAAGDLEAVSGRLAGVLGDRRPAALVARASQPDQAVVRSDLARIAAVAKKARLPRPSLLVVGEVAALGVTSESEAEAEAEA